ncbi:MAG: tetratricopeptide repeat protein [Candidatus Micrarchaeia archaeon]
MDYSNIRMLIAKKEYRAAGGLIDSYLSKDNENHYLWYLRGTASLGAKNYNSALECFEKALSIKKEFEYFRAMGITYFEKLDFEEAIIEFENALKIKKDSEIYFYISLCCMFLEDPRSKDFMETAYFRNRKKTKELLVSLYDKVLKDSRELSDKQKKELEKIIKSIK